MADFGWVEGAQRFTAVGANTAASNGTTVSAPGSTNTKGSYTQLIASTAHDASGLLLSGYFTAPSGAGYGLIDIAIGAASSEQVLISNIAVNRQTSNAMGWPPILIPCSIPAGARVSARYQASQTSATCVLSAQAVGGMLNYPILANRSETLGADTSTSKGTSIDPGGTANTKGSYVQMAASTAFASKWAILSFTADSPSTLGWNWLIDVAVGASSSEQIVVPNLWVPSAGLAGGLCIARVFMPLAIPAGTRVAMRCQSDTNTTGSRQLLATIHLFG